ncbi:MAG: hypothetical protein GX855_07590, partial [Firmicutes bacterium]|nr:hypothetical protein [Bacillota bacterium]
MGGFLRAALPSALIIIVGVGNIVPIKVFFGFEWLWGSIALLVLIRYWGVSPGLLGSFTAGLSAFIGGYPPYSPLVYLFEGLFVGYLRRRTKYSISSLAVSYWVGLALLFALSHCIGGWTLTQPASVFVTLRMLVNGIGNAVIAEAIIVLFDGHRRESNGLPSLRRVFATLTMAFLCISILLLVSFESWYEFRAIEQEIRNELRTSHLAISTAIQNELAGLSQTIALVAERVGSGSLAAADIQKDIELIDQASYGLLGLYVGDLDGTSIGFSPAFDSAGVPNVGRSFAHRDYYQELIRTQKPTTSELILTESLSAVDKPGTPVVVLAFPVFSHGELSGYAAGLLDLTFAKALLRSFTHDNSEITLLDQHRRVIASTNSKNVPGTELRHSGPREFHHLLEGGIEHHMAADESLPILEQWRRSYYVLEEPILTSELVVDIPWTLVVERPIAEDVDRLYGFYNYGLTFLLILLAAAAAVARVSAKWLGAPIRVLADLSEDLLGKLRKGEEITWPLP